MAKPEWGTKRICQSCGTKFYDMQHNPIVCPSCGTAFDLETVLRSRRTKAAPATQAKAKASKEDDDEIGDDDVEVEDDDGVMEDTDDLSDDDDLADVGIDDEDKE